MNDQKSIEKKPVSLVRRIAWIITIIAAIVLALVVAFVVSDRYLRDKAASARLREITAESESVLSVKPEYTATGALRISAADLLRRVQVDKQATQILLDRSTIEIHGKLTAENPVGYNGSSVNFQTDDPAIPITAGIDTAFQAKAAKLSSAATVTVRCRASNIFTDPPMVGPCDIIEN
jgi:hypothetical protein